MKTLPMLVLAGLAATAVAASAPATEVDEDSTSVTVTAPSTDVDVSSDKVSVEAPYTDVAVDKKNRHVRIRVPFFSGDINW